MKPTCERSTPGRRRSATIRKEALLVGLLLPVLCGCQMATSYGRKPTLCPETGNMYALTVYGNTSKDKVIDRKAEELLTGLMQETGANDYRPVLRIQYNTANKFFYVVELNPTNPPSAGTFSERMKPVPKVFGRSANYGYLITSPSSGSNYLCLTTWPEPLEDGLAARKANIKQFGGPGLTPVVLPTLGFQKGYGVLAVDHGRGRLELPAVRGLTIDGELVWLTDLDLPYQRFNLRDFSAAIAARKPR